VSGEAIERRSHQLSVLNDVARALNASVDLPTLLERALEKVAELLGLDTGWVLLFQEDTGEPYLAASQNLPIGLRREPEQLAGWCYCLESFRDGGMGGATNVGVVTCSRLRKLALAQGDTAGLRYHASVPLQVLDLDATPNESGPSARSAFRRLGMLNVASPEWRQLSGEELELLRTIGDVLSVAVERARLQARRLASAHAEERNRLAREIHDTIAQDLSAIAFHLEAAEALMSGAEGERARRSVSAALDLARKGLEEARRSVLDLRAAPLEGRTLAEALAALAQATTGDGLEIAFTAPAVPAPLPPATDVALYRIAQEALQNALRHARASRITLRLERGADVVRLTIEDDGQGFDVGAVASPRDTRRFGLLGMRERARLLGGDVHVESTPGVGTRVTATIPLGSVPPR
jgi:two-component system, NarL family, sensor kinase